MPFPMSQMKSKCVICQKAALYVFSQTAKERECLCMYSIQMCSLGKKTRFLSLIQFIWFCFQLITYKRNVTDVPICSVSYTRICLYFGETQEQESNMNCSIPVSQLSLSTGKSSPAKCPRWCDLLGWIHMQWQRNFKGLQHIFPLFLNSQMFFYYYRSEQYRNSCFSSVVEKTGKDKKTVEYITVGHHIRDALQMEWIQGICVIIKFNFFCHLIWLTW